jgi:hypothetical protein
VTITVTDKKPEPPRPLPRGLRAALRANRLAISPNTVFDHNERGAISGDIGYDGRWEIEAPNGVLGVSPIFTGTFEECAAIVLAVTPEERKRMDNPLSETGAMHARRAARAVLRRIEQPPKAVTARTGKTIPATKNASKPKTPSKRGSVSDAKATRKAPASHGPREIPASLKRVSAVPKATGPVTDKTSGRGHYVRKNRKQTCTVCGQKFVATRSDAAFCSNACRQRRYRERDR